MFEILSPQELLNVTEPCITNSKDCPRDGQVYLEAYCDACTLECTLKAQKRKTMADFIRWGECRCPHDIHKIMIITKRECFMCWNELKAQITNKEGVK